MASHGLLGHGHARVRPRQRLVALGQPRLVLGPIPVGFVGRYPRAVLAHDAVGGGHALCGRGWDVVLHQSLASATKSAPKASIPEAEAPTVTELCVPPVPAPATTTHEPV